MQLNSIEWLYSHTKDGYKVNHTTQESCVCVLKGVVDCSSVSYDIKTKRCDTYRGSREDAFTGTDSSLMFFLP